MPRPRADVVDELLAHNVVDVVERAHLQKRLLDGERLRIKLGFDPTMPDLHLGHALPLKKLRAFQDQGHTVVFILGDATARIGDPTGKSKARPPLSEADIQRNTQTYFDQVGRILDLKRAEIRRNSEWLDTLTFPDIMRLLGKFTVARVLEREDFAARVRKHAPIGLHELLYPLLQAYDSVAVRADVEVGGTDQTFNLLVGRDLQSQFHQAPQNILTVPLLVGLDGKEKMSKSLRNTIGLTESADAMVGKLMTIPDPAMPAYARLAADWTDEKLKALPRRLKKENPRDVKLEIARDIAAQYHGVSAAKRATAEWLRVFHKKELPKRILQKKLRTGSWDITELIVAAGLVPSKSEAKRVLSQGGVRQNGLRIEPSVKILTIAKGDLLQVGKRNFVRIS